MLKYRRTVKGYALGFVFGAGLACAFFAPLILTPDRPYAWLYMCAMAVFWGCVFSRLIATVTQESYVQHVQAGYPLQPSAAWVGQGVPKGEQDA